MTYSEQLHPWCIVRYLANQEYIPHSAPSTVTEGNYGDEKSKLA
jgi:hypothetical protein